MSRKIFNSPMLLGVVVAVLLIEVVVLYRPPAYFYLRDLISAVVPETVVALVNKEREEAGLSALVVNDQLTAAAQAKADDMATRGYFAHQGPEGEVPWVWLDRAGYRYTTAGENLAVNYFSSASLARAWLASERHRSNILQPDFKEVGLGIAHGEYKNRPAVFIVQFFATPRRTE